MNIILFVNSIDFGGASMYFSRMNKAFNKHGINSNLIYFKDEKKINKDKKSIDLTIIEKIKVIRKSILQNNADFIITNHGLETIMCKIASYTVKKKVKVITIVHIRSIMWIPQYKRKIKGFIFRIMIKISFNMCDKCIAVSDGLKKEIIDGKWINEKKIVTVYNPVIDDDFEYQTKTLTDKKEIHLGVIGWIWDIKNQMEVIIALHKLNDKRYKLHIIGGVKDEIYYKKIKEKIKELKLTEQVIFEGIKKNIYTELQYIDIVILSSRTEALPTVIIEAMASGTPVLATDCKFGPKEILINNSGVIYKINDVNCLAKNIKKISNDCNLYNNLSENAVKESRKFMYFAIVKKYLNILKGV